MVSAAEGEEGAGGTETEEEDGVCYFLGIGRVGWGGVRMRVELEDGVC